MSKKTKKIIFVVLAITVILSFFYTRIAKNVGLQKNTQNIQEEVEVVDEAEPEVEENNKTEEENKQESMSIELKKPPFIK
jgi:uncharacterized membrane protein (DUF106 family)